MLKKCFHIKLMLFKVFFEEKISPFFTSQFVSFNLKNSYFETLVKRYPVVLFFFDYPTGIEEFNWFFYFNFYNGLPGTDPKNFLVVPAPVGK